MLEEAALAKVNLYLRVVGRRADGYHLLDSLAVFPGAADRVFAEPAAGLSLRVTGPFADGLSGDGDNLVLRAARGLAAAAGISAGAALVLEKNLPVASGIGGGSADAAAALRVLSRLWGLGPASWPDLALRLGADVPVCLASRAARMEGVGEVLGPAPGLPPYGMVLVNPGVGVATPAVFRARAGGFSARADVPLAWAGLGAMVTALRALGNDLETAAVELCPAIGEVLAWLGGQDGCLLARMSGSGGTCFGVFADGAAAAAVAQTVPRGWWGWGGAA